MNTRKNSIRNWLRKCGILTLTTGLLLTGTITKPVEAYAVTFVKDTDGTKYAVDQKRGFYYALPKSATTKSGCSIYMYGGQKTDVTFPSKCNSYTVTTVSSNFSQLIMTKLTTVKLPSGYTTIEKEAFKGQTQLYRIEIPASVKSIGKNAFQGCDTTKLTIVAPYGSAAEKYAIANGINYSNSTALSIRTGGMNMFVREKKRITVCNNSKTITWASSDKKVATVSKAGTVTAKKAGNVKITAKINGKTYTYPFKVVSRTSGNVLQIVWDNYVTTDLSDYEKVVAANKWVKANIKPTGTSVSSKTALETGVSNYTGYANAYKNILEHYGLKVKVVMGKTHMENSVVIAGKTYTASTIESASGVDKNYTTTGLGVAINKSTMTLSVGGKGTFKALGNTKTVTWSSTNKKVATVTKSGKVTAKGAGVTTIIMKIGTKTYDCKVRVNK